MKYTEPNYFKNSLLHIAELMVIAARTAPKARGMSTLQTLIIDSADLETLANHLQEKGEMLDIPSFVRDAESLRKADVAVVMGAEIQTLGLKKCGMCGYTNCDEKKHHPDVPCVFNTGDLGIAVGSAVSIAMDHRVDNRIMYTAGQSVLELKWLGDKVKVAYVIPLSATSKNVFFDR